MVDSLEELLQEESLVGPVLEALQNLDLGEHLKHRVVAAVRAVVATASMDDLPVVIKFLLQAVGRGTAKEVVECLRENLVLIPGSDARSKVADRKQKGACR